MNNLPAVNNPSEVATLEHYANGLKIKLDMAATLLKSGLIPKSFTSPEGVLTAILYGQELGLSPMRSLMGIDVIQGRPSVNAATIKGMVIAAGGRIETVTWTDKVCTLIGHRGDWKEEGTFTIEDAKVAGYMNKENWIKQPRFMLYARAVSIIGRNQWADVTRGFYTTEELRDEAPERPPEIVSTAAERRKERAKAAEQSVVVEQEAVTVDAMGQVELPLEEKPREVHIYRVPEPTFEQRAFLTKHCEWDPEYKVWLAKKDLGEKLSKFKITQEQL